MYRKTLLLASTIFATSCGDEPPSDHCYLDDIDGDYDVTYTETGGDCGPMDPVVVTFVDGTQHADPEWGKDVDCYVHTEPVGECSYFSVVTCALRLEQVMIQHVINATQQPGGRVVKAVASIAIRDEYATPVCRGTYDVDYVRQ